MIRGLTTLLLGSVIGSAANAACHLSLLLALDVSSSIDEREYVLQRDGLASALASESVQTALLAGPGSVALAVYEWSGRYQHAMVLDWVTIDGAKTLQNAVTKIRAAERSYDNFPTAMGFALGHGANLMASAPPCERRTIDISGDGVTNDGFSPDQAYRHFPFGNITVNGLVVRTSDNRVPIYFANEVIRGPDAFLEIASSYADYEHAMHRKLLREIGVAIVGSTPSRETPNEG